MWVVLPLISITHRSKWVSPAMVELCIWAKTLSACGAKVAPIDGGLGTFTTWWGTWQNLVYFGELWSQGLVVIGGRSWFTHQNFIAFQQWWKNMEYHTSSFHSLPLKFNIPIMSGKFHGISPNITQYSIFFNPPTKCPAFSSFQVCYSSPSISCHVQAIFQ